MTRFDEFSLSEPILRAVREEGYNQPTPIQQHAIAPALEGRDLLGCAQTGTGKTAAFALPILERLASQPAPQPPAVRALILTPTRELATQIADSFRRYGRHLKLRCATVFGGVGFEPQARALRSGCDIIVATPGRLLDFLKQGVARLERVTTFVIDEADRMLDLGFIDDVRRITTALPRNRQTMLFSATLPHEITSLAGNILKSPMRVEATPPATTVEKISQWLHRVERGEKMPLLVRLLQDPGMRRVIVFTRTKRGANKVAEGLNKQHHRADAIHGNKGQTARERALEDFRRGKCRVLVATDIASRGIDVDDITHVVNYDMPDTPENYVHRIGRTARAGAEGQAITFCSAEERGELAAVEKLIRMRIPVAGGAEFAPAFEPVAAAPRNPAPRPHTTAQTFHGRPAANPRRRFGGFGRRRRQF